MNPGNAAVRDATDRRAAARGWGRLVIAAMWVFSLIVSWYALYTFFTHWSEAVAIRTLGIMAAASYILIAVSMTHNGRRMRIVGWSAWAANTTALMTVSVLTASIPDAWPNWASLDVWLAAGRAYGYTPIVVAIAVPIWLWWSNPRRIVELSERYDVRAKH